ncbi:Ig-like domain-containing protein [Cohnella ginsengisoli]|uniref:Ig-like domain-containing protein n=1 Tax=Cohnella ginsengisoli TaxID=425004 RepID=A0A9X4KFY6_9BACL|nr:Ig-like domain-containing protein [Cohnella ginsengisoli]MDG0791308.1 Ig-like domain-containing protein [Cohnella ginsengisoli]
MDKDVNIVLRGGTYERTSTFTLTSADSGRNGYRVYYKAYAGETPVISGGKTITGWALYDADANIYRAAVDAGLDTRQIYVNGERAQKARGKPPAGMTLKADGHTTPNLDMQHWRNTDRIEFVYRNNWQEGVCRVQSIVGGDIKMNPSCWSRVTSSTGLPYEIANAFELLDAPGEWYLDKEEHYLYYKPRAGENMATASVVVPVLERLVSVSGTYDQPLRNVTFEGIVFAYSTWLEPSGPFGFKESQANLMYPTDFEAQLPEDLVKIPAAVSVQAAEAVRFERNVFTHMGAGGLNIDMGRNNAIQGNILSDISGNGLMLGDVKAEDHHPSVPDRLVKDNRIENNVVTRAAQEYHGGVGIWVGYTENTLIAHNEVFDLPYSGISIGWGWGSVDSTDNPSASKDNKIIANHVHHLMQEMVDGGGIYSLGMQRNMLIQGNVVHDQLYDFGAYYLDDGSRYVTLDSNIAYGNKRNLIAKGSNHTIRGNYWDNESSNMNQYTNSTVENNQVTMPGQFPLAILNKAGLTAAYADLLDQVETSDESNVAAGKPAYAYDGTGGTLSSTEVDAGRATDKDLSTDTGVYGGSGPWALAVDLERSHLADAIVVSFPAGGVPSSFKVEIAGLDGIWETVASNATGHTGRNIVPMDGKRIRTVRVTAVSGSMAIAEVEVYKKNASVPLNKGFSIAVISSDNVASDSPSVVSIDGQHNVTGLADGAAVISHAGGDWQFKVDVAPFSNVALYAENTKVASGRSVQVFLKGTTTEGLNVPFDLQQIDFTSDNETKLSVDASGLVSAHGPGSANITASTAQEGAPIIRSLPFLAFEEAVDFVGVQVSVPYLHPAETAQISISELKYDSGYPVELADVDSIQYTSLNPDIATVNTTGLITALQPGQATFAVKVTVNGKQAETEVKLSVFPAGWAYANVNNAEGAAEFDGDSWRIQNKGSDIFGTADQFGFVYKAIDMNQYPQGVAITTTIQSLEDVHNATMTGLMMRSTLDPGSKNVNYRMHASQGLELKYMPFTWRTADNQATDYFYADNLPLPAKIRLIYADQIATAQYWDVTNSQWKTAGAVPIELGASFYVGAAHTSHDLERFSTTEISGISISDAENLPIRISADTNLLTTNATLSLYTAGKGVNETIRYTSDNEGVATVDQNGTVTAVATGKAVIKAQAMSGAVELPGRSDSIVVYVYDEPEQLHSVNKALNKPAAAMTSNLRGLLSTHPGAQETNGNDGNPNTGTQANGQYDWAYRVDLGGLQSVDRMAVTFNAGSFATQFEFLISRDGIDWEVMDSFNNTVGGTTYSTFFEETRMARYAVVRAIRPNGPAQPGSQMNVSEFEVFGQVVPADVSGVSLNRTNIVLGNGGTTKLTATVTPAGANPGVTWSSSDESVVTVDANGKLTAHAPGTATVTAASQENASLSATSTVSVREITNVALNQPSKGLTADLLQDADAGTPFANGNDGKMDTYAVPTGVWNWALRVDLGSVKDIGGMAVTFDPGGGMRLHLTSSCLPTVQIGKSSIRSAARPGSVTCSIGQTWKR